MAVPPNKPSTQLAARFAGCDKPARWIPVFTFGFWLLVTPVVILSPLFFEYIGEYLSRKPFDSAKWKASLATESDEPVRLRMVDHLLHTHTLRGLTRRQIEDLLGIPPATDYFQSYDLVYWLGPERGAFSIDSEWLAIRIGPDQRVAEACILRD